MYPKTEGDVEVVARHGFPVMIVAFRPRKMLSIPRSLSVETTQGGVFGRRGTCSWALGRRA